MKNINTTISYSLRFVVVLHAGIFVLLFVLQRPQVPGANSALILSAVLMFIVLALLIADWMTRKDETRKFSKLLDSIIGLGWLVTILTLVLRSLSMGTL
jgi:hypothetical protein